ncbi:MAG: MCP four helix bundle domain-containing protein [Candidatus Sericytochromatia bacterium]|nr:MCP four helix bundle domain-containing protein [Candidatus Tanganyikabacteria bacterium]
MSKGSLPEELASQPLTDGRGAPDAEAGKRRLDVGYYLKSAPIAFKVVFIFLPLFALVCIVGAVGYVNILSLKASVDQIAQTHLDRIRLANSGVARLKDLHRYELLMIANPGVRGYWNGRFNAADEALRRDLAELEQKVDADRQQALEDTRTAYEEFMVAHRVVLKSLESGQIEEARHFATRMSQLKVEAVDTLLGGLVGANNEQIQAIAASTADQVHSASQQITLWLALAFAAGLLVIVMLIRFITGITMPVKVLEQAAADIAQGDLSRTLPPVASADEIGRLTRSFDTMVSALTRLVQEITRTADELQINSAALASASTESGEAASRVALSVGDVARGAAKQVEDVNTSADRVTEISQAARSLANNVQLAADNGALLAGAAGEAQDALEQARQKMEQAERTVIGTTNVVRRLSDMGKNIGQISELIGSFAKKTNFLALNAGVEAARAGEEGRGFAVLASEIRKLAMESGQAARRIADMVEHIQNETGDAIRAMDAGYEEVTFGVTALEDANFAIERIAQVIRDSDRELREIADATRKVAQSSSWMAQSMESVAAICEQTAAGAQEVSATAELQNATAEEIAVSAQTLAQLALDLKGLIRQFKVG